MSDPEPERARLFDLFRPRALYRGILARPAFVLPVLVLVGCAVLYTQLAVGPALPRVIPQLLERSFATQSELERTFRYFVLFVSIFLPLVVVASVAIGGWLLLRATRVAVPFPNALSLVAHASLWVALGFLVKAALVAITDEAEPATSLAFFLRATTPLEHALLALTNPFALLAAWWTVRGLRAWGVPAARAWVGGAVPWAAWIVLVAQSGSEPAGRFAPTDPVDTSGWGTLRRGVTTVLYPPDLEDEAAELADAIAAFTDRAAGFLDFEPAPLRIHAYPDHEALERATGEFLHVQVTGSIRGTGLLYVEMPGHSAAVTRENGLREAIRYAGIMQIAPVLPGAPRWFVHGTVHAAVYPGSVELERRYRRIVQRSMPTYEDLLDPRIFRTPDGPILARALVDYIAYHYGPETPGAIQRDLRAGIPFRDALYSRTRLTTTALEVGWQDSIRALLADSGPQG